MVIDVALIISFLSLCVAAIVAFVSIKRNKTADDRNEATEMTTVIVKLENISNGISEIKAEMKSVKSDVQALRDRVIVAEQAIKSAQHRLDSLEGKEK